MDDVVDEDIEDFIHDLGVAIYDINKKHSNVLQRTNLGNSMTQYFRYVRGIKEAREEAKKKNE